MIFNYSSCPLQILHQSTQDWGKELVSERKRSVQGDCPCPEDSLKTARKAFIGVWGFRSLLDQQPCKLPERNGKTGEGVLLPKMLSAQSKCWKTVGEADISLISIFSVREGLSGIKYHRLRTIGGHSTV